MIDLFSFKRVFEYFLPILSRLPVTLLITFSATLLGLILGVILALIRLYRIPVLNQLSAVFISFMRGTPIIVQMFIIFYGLPALLIPLGIDINGWDKMVFVITTYGLNLASFLVEIFRASIISVPAGQAEAAYSVGLTRLQTFRRVIAPQALKSALPSLGVSMVGLLQDTSVAFPLGIIDIMGKVRAIGANTQHVLEGYIVAAVIFIVLSYLLEKAFTLLETRYSY